MLQNKAVGLEGAIKNFTPINQEETFCIDSLLDAFVILENSSDAENISDAISCAIEKLNEHKKQLWEEQKGKIKTAPFIFLLMGLFIALVLI